MFGVRTRLEMFMVPWMEHTMRFTRATLETWVQDSSAIGITGGESVIAVGVMWGVRIAATPGSVLILTPATSGQVIPEL